MKEFTIVALVVLCIALAVQAAGLFGKSYAERDWERRTSEWRAQWERYEATLPPIEKHPESIVTASEPE